MGERAEIRELSSLDELQEVVRLLEEVWGDDRVLTVELLRALSTHGNPVLGAYLDDDLVGAQMSFLGRKEGGELILHSHVTGVPEGRQHTGVGFDLKAAQRDWALAHGIATVTWTFDPTIARNAYFNLRKLGARAERFFRNFYGEMDDAFNAGERTDRLEIVWRLREPRVEAALTGKPVEVDIADAGALLEEEDGHPILRRGAETPRLVLRVPSEHLRLRREDPAVAGAWRDAVADAFEDALGRGYVAVDFHREGLYVLERV